tara:strand:- start:102 stop:326 length:225 start_codon:yes stop_codon:yes gene_type:complete
MGVTLMDDKEIRDALAMLLGLWKAGGRELCDALVQCDDRELFGLKLKVSSAQDALSQLGDEIDSLRNALEEGGE